MTRLLLRAAAASLGILIPSALAGDSLIVTQEANLTPRSGVWGDVLGFVVDLDGSIVAASALGWPGGDWQGKVYLFERLPGAWIISQELLSPDPDGTRFGIALALRGEYPLVMATNGGNPNHWPTKAHAYVRGAGGTFAHEGKLDIPGAPASFVGEDIAIDGTTALVSNGSGSSGWARVFVRGTQGWEVQDDLVAVPVTASFGAACALDGITAVVGVPSDGEAGFAAGAAHVFTRNGEQWVHRTKILPPPGAEENFGSSLALKVGTLAVGTPAHSIPGGYGAVYVYEGGGAQWNLVASLQGEDPTGNDHFGGSVALDDDLLLIGEAGDGTPNRIATVRAGPNRRASRRKEARAIPTSDPIWISTPRTG